MPQPRDETAPQSADKADITPHVQFWRKLTQVGLKRLALISLSVGAGLGLCVVSLTAVISWYQNQPVPARQWPPIDVPAIGIKARLTSDWDGVLPQLEMERAFLR